MLGSPSKKSRQTWNIWGFKIQVRDMHANEHNALKWLGGDPTGRKRGSAVHWTVSPQLVVIDIKKTSLKQDFIFI